MESMAIKIDVGAEFLDVVEFLPDAAFAVDINGMVMIWNRAMEKLTGVPRNEILGKGCSSYQKAIYTKESPALIDLVISDSEVIHSFNLHHDENDCLRSDEWLEYWHGGNGAFISTSVSRLHDHTGNVCGAIQIMRDVTQKWQIERSLSKTNRALKSLVAVNQVLVNAQNEPDFLVSIVRIITNVKGYVCAWIAYINPAVSGQLEIVAQSGFGNAMKDIRVICGNKEFGCSNIAAVIDTGECYVTRNIRNKIGCERCCADAESMQYSATIVLPLIQDHHTFGVVQIYAEEGDAFDTDEMELLQEMANDLAFGITTIRTRQERDRVVNELQIAHDQLELKIAERTRELIEVNTRLKELDRLKSMFIASMSHELRTPLNSIIGFSGIILGGMSGEINCKQREQLERVYSSGKHLLELISDVIDIAKIEGDRIDVYPQHLMLNEIMDEVVEYNRKLAARKNLEINIGVHNNIAMFTDRKRLCQVVNNLVSNAVKYTEDGSITIGVREMYGIVEIMVSDTGIGISKEEIPKLFKAFERLDTHLKVKEGGTGLGLYLTEKLVSEVLEGEIQVESEKDKGSTFIIRVAQDLRDISSGN